MWICNFVTLEENRVKLGEVQMIESKRECFSCVFRSKESCVLIRRTTRYVFDIAMVILLVDGLTEATIVVAATLCFRRTFRSGNSEEHF